jgi:hypothetical protein
VSQDSDLVSQQSLLPTETEGADKRRLYLLYLYLPIIFLTSALLGGVRFSIADNTFIFLKPSLVCLIFAAMLMVLFARAGLIQVREWFAEERSFLNNAANGVALSSVFIASTQIFNSLIPEQGLPYWIVAFCFFWTLWNNIFAEFDTRRLVRSLGALFALAFVVKYLVLLNLASPADRSWFEAIIQSPSRSAASWLLDVPQFSAATGYIQFFAVASYMFGLFLLPSAPNRQFRNVESIRNSSSDLRSGGGGPAALEDPKNR